MGFRELDAELDLRKSTLEHWEAGRVQNLPIAQVMALAAYLEIPLKDLQEAALADASELRGAGAGTPASPAANNAPAESAHDDDRVAVAEAAERQHQERAAASRRRSKGSKA